MSARENKIITSTPEFKRLVASRGKISMLFTATIFGVYFGFLLLVAFGKEWLSITITIGLTLAIALGIAILVFTWIITGIYIYWANNVYDKQVTELKKQLAE
ncbi:MAG: DUF485 domain-containing protein [Cytophagales bacterium]|nr:DUF485 domain-containing protein [Cytophagales bacterium]